MASFAALAFCKLLQPSPGNTTYKGSTVRTAVFRKSLQSADGAYFAGRIHSEFFQFLWPRRGAELRLLHGDTCGSSSGAGALRPPGSGSGRNQARRPDGRRTLLNPSAVGHDSHRTRGREPPAREIFALPSALFHKRRIRHGAHPYFQFLAVGPFSSARGLKWNSPIPAQFREERSQNATICREISRSNGINE